MNYEVEYRTPSGEVYTDVYTDEEAADMNAEGALERGWAFVMREGATYYFRVEWACVYEKAAP